MNRKKSDISRMVFISLTSFIAFVSAVAMHHSRMFPGCGEAAAVKAIWMFMAALFASTALAAFARGRANGWLGTLPGPGSRRCVRPTGADAVEHRLSEFMNPVVGAVGGPGGAEAMRRESEERWRALFESTGDAVFILKDGVHADCNQGALNFFGCGRDRIIGCSPTDFSPELQPDGKPSRDRMTQELAAALRGEPRTLRWTFRRGRGVSFEARLSLKAISLNAEPHVLAAASEIPGPAPGREAMIHMEKMMMVGGLASGVVHEINNSLGGILQNIQIMENRVSGDLPGNRRTALECEAPLESIRSYMEKRGLFRMMGSIMKSGVRAANIIDNLLTFSRGAEAHYAPRDLRMLLDRTVELARNDFNLKDKYDFRQIEIHREYESAMPDVPCKGNTVQMVFFKILINGAYAMSDAVNREADAEKPRFILRVHPDGEMARVEIEDNGPGPGEDGRGRAFERLFTIEGACSERVAKLFAFIIAEDHRGEMAVESPAGKGLRFVIRLPLRRPPKKE